MSNFVVLKTFPLAVEAEMLRGRLESEGIRCFLEGERLASVVGDFSQANAIWNGSGGTKVLVGENDLTQARAVLNQIEYASGSEKPRQAEQFQSIAIWFFWLVVAAGVLWFVVASAFPRKF